MSWWNDLSTHRNVSTSGYDGALRQPSSSASPRDRRPTSPEQQGGCIPSTFSGSFAAKHGTGSEDATWGTSATHSDLTSLWQTSGSGGISDQLGMSENSPIWGPQPPRTSASPLPRCADAFAGSPSLSGKGMLGELVRPLSVAGSRSSYADNTAVLSTAANGVSALNVHATIAPPSTGVAAPGTHRTVASPDHNTCEGDEEEEEDDDASLYDDVDLGTISSLIASLQGRSTQADNDDGAANTLRSSQGGDRTRCETPLTSAASAIVVDAAAVAASPPPSSAPAMTRTRGLFADPMRHRSQSGAAPPPTFASRAEGEGDGRGASGGSPLAPASARPASETSTIAPLHLTPSMLEGILANFQTALNGRAGEAAFTTSPTPQVADAELLHPDRYNTSVEGQEEGQHQHDHHQHHHTLSGGVEAEGRGAADGAPLASRGSPLMRTHVSPVVAHKLNIDANPRGTPVQDVRRGLAASTASSCSDSSTPIRQRGASVPDRHPPARHVAHQRPASPDSSIDRFFSHTTPATATFAAAHPLVSSSTIEESVLAHPHQRTESDISLPAAASTYNGSSALHQHVDERGCITVVDPQRRKLHVPLSAIHTTKALNGRLKTPSLCLLFQSGRCRQGDNCYQVHVDPPTVNRLRVDVESMPCCCLLHGDGNCHLVDPAVYEGRSLCIAGQYNVPLSRVAYTAGLQRVLQEESTSVPVNPSVLCRLHGQRGGCRFGADCKFVHVCCSILQNELATIMSSAATAANAQLETHAGQQPQQMQPRLVSSAPGSPSTFMHARQSSTMGLMGSAGNLPLPSTTPPSAMITRQMQAIPAGAGMGTMGELSLSPPLPMQPARAMPSNASPMLLELRQSGSGQQMGMSGGSAGATLYNRNFPTTSRPPGHGNSNNNSETYKSNSLLSSANISPSQLSQSVSFLSNNAYGNAPTLPGAAPSGFTNVVSQSSGPLFMVATMQQQQQQQQQQQLRNSPAQSPAGRPAPPPQLPSSTSLPNSPQSGYHMRTLSTQSNGNYPHYPSSAFAPTPNRSGAGSPVNVGLPAARSLPNLCGSTGAFAPRNGGRSGDCASSPTQQRQQRQVTPPQPQPQQQQQPQHHHQHSTSQQLYVQQVNKDGTVSFVPVNMMQSMHN